MNLIMTMIFMKIPLKFQVLLQQCCLVDKCSALVHYTKYYHDGLLAWYHGIWDPGSYSIVIL